jgi:hypothetical protein
LRGKGVQLLKYGQVTRGKLGSKVPTNTRINKRTVYKLTFNFTAADGSSRQVTATAISRQSEDETYEQILYDPANPDRACWWIICPARRTSMIWAEFICPARPGAGRADLPLLVTSANGCACLMILARGV